MNTYGPAGNVMTVDVGAIRDNIVFVKSLQPKTTRMYASVKANGYGTSMEQISRVLVEEPAMKGLVSGLMVAHTNEARAILEDFKIPSTNVMVVHCEAEDFAFCAQNKDKVEVCVGSALDIDMAVAACKQANSNSCVSDAAKAARLRLHLQVDTGMTRLGCAAADAVALAKKIRVENAEHVVFEGLMTHMATADDNESDFPHVQEERFLTTLDALKNNSEIDASLMPANIHTQNSAWALRYSPPAPAESGDPPRIMRVGIAMYGYCNGLKHPNMARLKSAVTLRTRIAGMHIVPEGATVSYARLFTAPKDGTRIAVINVGYTEGLRHPANNRGAEVVVFSKNRGVAAKRCPVVGKICMDFSCVDVTDMPEADVGDAVLVYGTDPATGVEGVTLEKAAENAQISCHEIMAKGMMRFLREFVNVPK